MDERSVMVAVQTDSAEAAEALRRAAIRCAKAIYLPDGRRRNAHAQFGHAGHAYRLYYLDDQGWDGGPGYLVLPGIFGGSPAAQGVCEGGPPLPEPWPLPVRCSPSMMTPGYGLREHQELRWLAYHEGEPASQAGYCHRGHRLRLHSEEDGWVWRPARMGEWPRIR